MSHASFYGSAMDSYYAQNYGRITTSNSCNHSYQTSSNTGIWQVGVYQVTPQSNTQNNISMVPVQQLVPVQQMVPVGLIGGAGITVRPAVYSPTVYWN